VRSLVARELRGFGTAGPSKRDAIATLRDHLDAGHLTPVIDRTFPLDRAAEAIRYLAGGEPVGRVIVTP
jgi:NADPH:quinone reductase-like Zn-dependent oxidoreductase